MLIYILSNKDVCSSISLIDKIFKVYRCERHRRNSPHSISHQQFLVENQYPEGSPGLREIETLRTSQDVAVLHLLTANTRLLGS